MRSKLKALNERRARLVTGGTQEEVERQHARGKLTARERIDLLLDGGSFRESELWAVPRKTGFDIDGRQIPGDAVLTGYGEVNNRPIYLYAQDFTCLGGTMATVHAQKVIQTMEKALKMRLPCVHLIDSGGLRFQDYVTGYFRDAYPSIFRLHTISSGVIPQIAVMMGPCLVGAAYAPILTDFVIMVKSTSYMYIAGPPILKTATFVDITDEELGGAMMHATVSGCCDVIAENDEDAINKCEKLLSYLPSNSMDSAPILDTQDAPNRRDEELLDIVPLNAKKVYDMHEVIYRIVDDKDFFPIKADYAKNIITGFARFGGRPVGIIANNPKFLAGSIDINASDKEARFIRFCDAFNIPLLFLVDTPAYLPGVDQERGGIIRHGAKVLYAVSESTVPKITIYIRKGYAGANPAMAGVGMGSDLLLAWPSAQIALITPEAVVNAVYRKEIREAQHPDEIRQKRLDEYKAKIGEQPYHAAEIRWIEDVIDPRDTRPIIIKALNTFSNKTEERPWRKHGNIPL